ncbi:MAG TPA: four helix bundle protein [Gemmatimonadaceae bacterium]|nr:four helix bundle protein [Gemmatimonadaceae bacterium]
MSDSEAPEPGEPSGDPLARMRVYQIARELVKESWDDAEILAVNPITRRVAGQLYAAIGSIAANISEGYSRSSGRDRARIFEYALGSTRESGDWYHSGERVLGRKIVVTRLKKLEEIRRMLLTIIPRERDRVIRPSADSTAVKSRTGGFPR